MATRHVRTADRRAWYAWKLARCLNAASIRSAAWPPPEEDWCRRVYVGRDDRPEPDQQVMVVEFEPDLPLDVDATWSARLMLPDCCRATYHSESMDIELDVPDPDGTVDTRRGRGARLHDVAVRIGQAWADHNAHSGGGAVHGVPGRPALRVAGADGSDERVRQPDHSRQAGRRHGEVRHPVAPVAAVAGV